MYKMNDLDIDEYNRNIIQELNEAADEGEYSLSMFLHDLIEIDMESNFSYKYIIIERLVEICINSINKKMFYLADECMYFIRYSIDKCVNLKDEIIKNTSFFNNINIIIDTCSKEINLYNNNNNNNNNNDSLYIFEKTFFFFILDLNNNVNDFMDTWNIYKNELIHFYTTLIHIISLTTSEFYDILNNIKEEDDNIEIYDIHIGCKLMKIIEICLDVSILIFNNIDKIENIDILQTDINVLIKKFDDIPDIEIKKKIISMMKVLNKKIINDKEFNEEINNFNIKYNLLSNLSNKQKYKNKKNTKKNIKKNIKKNMKSNVINNINNDYYNFLNITKDKNNININYLKTNSYIYINNCYLYLNTYEQNINDITMSTSSSGCNKIKLSSWGYKGSLLINFFYSYFYNIKHKLLVVISYDNMKIKADPNYKSVFFYFKKGEISGVLSNKLRNTFKDKFLDNLEIGIKLKSKDICKNVHELMMTRIDIEKLSDNEREKKKEIHVDKEYNFKEDTFNIIEQVHNMDNDKNEKNKKNDSYDEYDPNNINDNNVEVVQNNHIHFNKIERDDMSFINNHNLKNEEKLERRKVSFATTKELCLLNDDISVETKTMLLEESILKHVHSNYNNKWINNNIIYNQNQNVYYDNNNNNNNNCKQKHDNNTNCLSENSTSKSNNDSLLIHHNHKKEKIEPLKISYATTRDLFGKEEYSKGIIEVDDNNTMNIKRVNHHHNNNNNNIKEGTVNYKNPFFNHVILKDEHINNDQNRNEDYYTYSDKIEKKQNDQTNILNHYSYDKENIKIINNEDNTNKEDIHTNIYKKNDKIDISNEYITNNNEEEKNKYNQNISNDLQNEDNKKYNYSIKNDEIFLNSKNYKETKKIHNKNNVINRHDLELNSELQMSCNLNNSQNKYNINKDYIIKSPFDIVRKLLNFDEKQKNIEECLETINNYNINDKNKKENNINEDQVNHIKHDDSNTILNHNDNSHDNLNNLRVTSREENIITKNMTPKYSTLFKNINDKINCNYKNDKCLINKRNEKKEKKQIKKNKNNYNKENNYEKDKDIDKDNDNDKKNDNDHINHDKSEDKFIITNNIKSEEINENVKDEVVDGVNIISINNKEKINEQDITGEKKKFKNINLNNTSNAYSQIVNISGYDEPSNELIYNFENNIVSSCNIDKSCISSRSKKRISTSMMNNITPNNDNNSDIYNDNNNSNYYNNTYLKQTNDTYSKNVIDSPYPIKKVKYNYYYDSKLFELLKKEDNLEKLSAKYLIRAYTLIQYNKRYVHIQIIDYFRYIKKEILLSYDNINIKYNKLLNNIQSQHDNKLQNILIKYYKHLKEHTNQKKILNLNKNIPKSININKIKIKIKYLYDTLNIVQRTMKDKILNSTILLNYKQSDIYTPSFSLGTIISKYSI
ncbi:conserved Plasmodium protein, unknown function [Plasmodium sp. gorilla clade G2]|uniref:conserved Plasmodium protein, unknown function n=1 Tax=Plasmodium sp. gorilla clade G2 TaxID=880535 RepID=UPI000D229F8D|nr:conserved Plasmodium protein, unknown function [Plasmodium sp. gorilla clade G2]SOV15406.1 conserved Plasmodium protein, unknown function [Plasmodium sp. gorilla clade G2]